MINAKVSFYKDRNNRIVSTGVIVDKVLLKEFEVAVTGYLILVDKDIHCVKCWDLIKIIEV